MCVYIHKLNAPAYLDVKCKIIFRIVEKYRRVSTDNSIFLKHWIIMVQPAASYIWSLTFTILRNDLRNICIDSQQIYIKTF